MSRNRSFLFSKAQKVVRSFLPSQATNPESDGLFSVLKRVKIYLMPTAENNRLHTIILAYVHKNIFDNMYLAVVANEFVDRKDSPKQIFPHFSQNYS